MKRIAAHCLAAAVLAATPFAFGQTTAGSKPPAPASTGADPMSRMLECLKLPPASPQQDACMAQVRKAHAAMPKQKPLPTAASKTKSAGGDAPKVIEPPAEFKAAAQEVSLAGAGQTKGSTVSAIGGVVTVGDLKGLDLETAMMAIQTQRANLLEGQLKQQLDAVQARNDEIARLNQMMSALRAARPGTPTGTARLGPSDAAAADLLAKLKAAGIATPATASASQKDVDAGVNAIKAKIDAISTTQQMDMLRLQSLSNKRNEAFDLMTNFIKKMADSRSSILGNMR